MHNHAPEVTQETGHLFDVRGISRRFRHVAVFAALDTMQEGERMHFVNDHDPIPLLNQIEQYFGDSVKATYLKNEPDETAICFEKME